MFESAPAVASTARPGSPPFDIRLLAFGEILQKRRQLRRELMKAPHLQPIRIAVLGGTTTNELVDLLEILLLGDGFQPAFYQSEYNKYFEEAVLDSERLQSFQPDLIYIHTHYLNIQNFPPISASEADLSDAVACELDRFRGIWNALVQAIPGCQIVQSNFEHSPFPALGNLDSTAPGGKTRFINELNLALARDASANRALTIHDLNALAARTGLSRWFDWGRWHSYKVLTTPESTFAIAGSLAALVGAMRGKAKKCLILDLDNTLWGGVIGDDGLDRIQIGKETPVAEAYTAFQHFCLALHDRGVLLAVCSKNEEETAKSGFGHPDSVLKLEHFASFKANWAPKHENIQAIASELNLGLDSFVFVDDSPAERAIVAAQLPAVAVPDVGSDIALFPSIVQSGRYFEAVTLSKEDLERSAAYAANAARARLAPAFASYGEYLESLRMSAEIEPFCSLYLDRITQLINKSNQFNLTTRRYTTAEIERIAASPAYLTLYGKLEDSFGDNGLISTIIGRREEKVLHIDLWIMSCRVLKRDMERAMLDRLVEFARDAGIERLAGYYRQTAKNEMVRNHYAQLGFEPIECATDGSSSVWSLPVAGYEPKNKYILIRELLTTNG